MADRPRVLVALPNSTECAEIADWLSSENFEPVKLANTRDAVADMRARPFDLLIADASFTVRERLHTKGRARNPLTPALVIGSESDAPTGDDEGTTMYLARPVERAVLMCFVTMAFLEGRPARRSVRKPVNRFDAFVNGVPSRLLDVSSEGLRIEVPPSRLNALPALFNVRVPLVGVTVSVKRMWTQPSSTGTATWCGGLLADNRPGAQQGWRSFVDTIPIPRG